MILEVLEKACKLHLQTALESLMGMALDDFSGDCWLKGAHLREAISLGKQARVFCIQEMYRATSFHFATSDLPVMGSDCTGASFLEKSGWN